MFFLCTLVILFIFILLLSDSRKRRDIQDIKNGIYYLHKLGLDNRRYNKDDNILMCELIKDLESALSENTAAEDGIGTGAF